MREQPWITGSLDASGPEPDAAARHAFTCGHEKSGRRALRGQEAADMLVIPPRSGHQACRAGFGVFRVH